METQSSSIPALYELRDAMLDWFAVVGEVSISQALPAFRWLCEARGCSFEEPTVECLNGVLASLRRMALIGGSSPTLVDARIAPFRHALAEH